MGTAHDLRQLVGSAHPTSIRQQHLLKQLPLEAFMLFVDAVVIAIVALVEGRFRISYGELVQVCL